MTPVQLAAAVFAGLAGMCVGSFIATAVLRGLQGEQALTGRSRCDGCARPLGFLETAPVLSYALARGRCRCGGRIDRLHLAGELGGGALCAAMWSAPVADGPGAAARALGALIGLLLLAAALYDARTFRLPDPLTAAIAALALLLAALQGRLAEAVVCGGAAFVMVEAVRRGYRRLRGREGLGRGDVKLLGALGLWLGPGLAPAVVAACVLALAWLALTGRPDRRLPFGPFLALGASLIATLQIASAAPP